MYKLTNKELLATKEERFEYMAFDAQGLRANSYGNIDIVKANREVMRDTMKGMDVLLIPYDEKRAIKIICALESHLKRRAKKQEIIDFVNNGYQLVEDVKKESILQIVENKNNYIVVFDHGTHERLEKSNPSIWLVNALKDSSKLNIKFIIGDVE